MKHIAIILSLFLWFGCITTDPTAPTLVQPSKTTLAKSKHHHHHPPLPIELLYFTGSHTSAGINLTWATLTEINNYGFNIQKLLNDEFSTIGFVPGNGTTNVPHTYEFLDSSISAEDNVYQLIQIDLDGQQHIYGPLIIPPSVSNH